MGSNPAKLHPFPAKTEWPEPCGNREESQAFVRFEPATATNPDITSCGINLPGVVHVAEFGYGRRLDISTEVPYLDERRSRLRPDGRHIVMLASVQAAAGLLLVHSSP